MPYLDADGTLPYKNMFDCFAKTIKHEGFLNLWVGLPTYYFRVAPHAMISVLVQDYIHEYLNKHKKKEWSKMHIIVTLQLMIH